MRKEERSRRSPSRIFPTSLSRQPQSSVLKRAAFPRRSWSVRKSPSSCSGTRAPGLRFTPIRSRFLANTDCTNAVLPSAMAPIHPQNTGYDASATQVQAAQNRVLPPAQCASAKPPLPVPANIASAATKVSPASTVFNRVSLFRLSEPQGSQRQTQ